MSVFGVCSGSLTDVEIELDGAIQPPLLSFPNSLNFQWFQKDGLSSANHTLKMTYMGGTSISILNLDYIIYTPSFASFSENGGPSAIPASSQPPTRNTVISPPMSTLPSNSQPSTTNSTTSLPSHIGISHAKLWGLSLDL